MSDIGNCAALSSSVYFAIYFIPVSRAILNHCHPTIKNAVWREYLAYAPPLTQFCIVFDLLYLKTAK